MQMLFGALINLVHAIITYDGFYDGIYPWATLIILLVWFLNTMLGHHAPHETTAYSKKYAKVED